MDDPTIDVKGAWAAIYNLSTGGVCVVTTEPMGIGAKRTFELVERKSGNARTITGKVVWAIPICDDLRRLGIEWQDLDTEARHWLASQLGEG